MESERTIEEAEPLENVEINGIEDELDSNVHEMTRELLKVQRRSLRVQIEILKTLKVMQKTLDKLESTANLADHKLRGL